MGKKILLAFNILYTSRETESQYLLKTFYLTLLVEFIVRFPNNYSSYEWKGKSKISSYTSAILKSIIKIW